MLRVNILKKNINILFNYRKFLKISKDDYVESLVHKIYEIGTPDLNRKSK